MLSAYDIRYVPRNAMQVQAAANFITKMTPPLKTSEPPVEEWKVYANGACKAEGSGIRIFLESQTRIKLLYTAKLAFSATTNNIAEYETVIMALKIIAEISTHKYVIFSD